MIVAGVMSGTSADGIDVAFVDIEPPSDPPAKAPALPTLKFLAHAEYDYPKDVRRAVLAAMNAEQASVADLSRLSFLLAELYAEAVESTQRKFRLKAALIGCHGQTLYHQGEPATYLGRKLSVTWQSGEGAVLATRHSVPVVSDFRPADMAAGGKGAPLVPFLDYLVFRDDRIGRIAQNIGGIANLTAIPPAASIQQVKAFDTGPGNMLIDAATEHLFGRPFDAEGKIAASGKVLEPIIEELLQSNFFAAKPPKTAGREEFGRIYARDFLKRCEKFDKADVVATATSLTARSISEAIRNFVLPLRGSFAEIVVSGGGARNPVLMAMLADETSTLGLKMRTSEDFGLPSQAKEAAAFALLAYQTWNRQPSNIPSATGAGKAVILGKVSYA